MKHVLNHFEVHSSWAQSSEHLINQRSWVQSPTGFSLIYSTAGPGADSLMRSIKTSLRTSKLPRVELEVY